MNYETSNDKQIQEEAETSDKSNNKRASEEKAAESWQSSEATTKAC